MSFSLEDNYLPVTLFGLAAIAFGYAVIVRGFRATVMHLFSSIKAIRAFDVWGIGIRLIGIHPDTSSGTAAATLWITFFYFPIIPIARRIVRFVDPGLHESAWMDVERTALDGKEVIRTYLMGWVLFPALVVGPFLLERAIEGILSWSSLPIDWQTDPNNSEFALLLRLGLILLGIPWLGVSAYMLLRWDQKRKQPLTELASSSSSQKGSQRISERT